ncbi:MAG TPA: hypothetical protein VGK43_00370, partial [Solirubrobacterales bacterium]
EEAMILLVTVIATVVGTILALEAWAWVPHLSSQLLRRTIDSLSEGLPPDQSARWAEEVEADFETYQSRRIGGLVFAVRFRLSGGRGLLEELSSEADAEPDPGDLQASRVIPKPAFDHPVAEPAPMPAVEAPLRRTLRRHLLVERMVEHRRAVMAIWLLSLCTAVALDVLEEREQG